MKVKKKHNVPKPSKHYSKHHKVHVASVKINKKVLKNSFFIFIFILIVASFFLFAKPKMEKEEAMLYFYPTNCNSEICNPEQMENLMEGIPVKFYSVDFVKFPIMIIPKSNNQAELIQVDNQNSILDGLCKQGKEKFCNMPLDKSALQEINTKTNKGVDQAAASCG